MNDDETIENARKELEAMKRVLDALDPLEPAARFRALAATAARFGFYDVARRALDAAQDVDDRSTP
jgi:hypothetical protein